MTTEEFKGAMRRLGEKFVTVVALGDSNTEVNHWTMGSLNWVGLLQCNLHQCFRNGFTLINSGRGGDTAAGAMGRLERDVLRFKPDLVIVSFGLNDSGSGCGVDAFADACAALLAKIRAGGGQVLLRTPNPIIGNVECRELDYGGAETAYPVGEFAAAAKAVADREGVACVDHHSLWMRSLQSKYRGEMQMLMGNCLHPNGNGHRRFYHELAPSFGLEERFQFEFGHLLEMEHLKR